MTKVQNVSQSLTFHSILVQIHIKFLNRFKQSSQAMNLSNNLQKSQTTRFGGGVKKQFPFVDLLTYLLTN